MSIEDCIIDDTPDNINKETECQTYESSGENLIRILLKSFMAYQSARKLIWEVIEIIFNLIRTQEQPNC
jgi:hypothetical protein